MATIDFVDWRPGSEPLFAHRYPETNLSTLTQLVVHESQEAILFSKGVLAGKFGPGKHTLNTENLPILRNFYGLPFGGKNPFTAEIWFVNKLLPLNIKWTTDGMMHHDPDYQTMVPLIARGNYGLRVDDAERFLVELVGTATDFTAEQLTAHFEGEVQTKTKTAISQFMLAQRIGIKTVSACLDALSNGLHPVLEPFWQKFGFKLAAFYVTSIEIDGTSEAGRKILEAMSQQSAQVIAGYTWQQNRLFEVADSMSKNPGGGGGSLLSAVVMSSLLPGLTSGMGGALQPGAPAALPGTGTPTASGSPPSGAARDVFCSSCSKRFSNSVSYCPNCGHKYNPCPQCGADNDQKAGRCVSCGCRLAAPASLAASSSCGRCHAVLDGNSAFCSKCGNKVD